MKKIKNYVRNDNFKMILKDNIIYIENFFDIGNISDKEIIVLSYDSKIIIR